MDGVRSQYLSGFALGVPSRPPTPNSPISVSRALARPSAVNSRLFILPGFAAPPGFLSAEVVAVLGAVSAPAGTSMG